MNMKTKFFTSKIIFHVISNGNKKGYIVFTLYQLACFFNMRVI